jgi:hypothetical protein
MKKLLLALAAGMLLVASVGCAYTGAVSDNQGKLYISRANLNGLWASFYTCEPSGGNLNCKEAALMGAGAPAAEGGEEAAAAQDAAEETGEAADEAAADETAE